MRKKSSFYLIFAIFVLVLFSSCSKKYVNCKFFPNFGEYSVYDSFDREGTKNFIKSKGVYTQFKCNF